VGEGNISLLPSGEGVGDEGNNIYGISFILASTSKIEKPCKIGSKLKA
jgi:hypothetical protein